MKPIAIVIAQSDRKELIEQTLRSLEQNTTFGAFKLFTKDGMKDGEMKTVNSLVRSIDYDWEWLVRSDDDIYFNRGWLKGMMLSMARNPDVWLLGGCRYPLHKPLGEREDVYIMEKQAGNHWLIPRWVWEEYGPFYENFVENQAEDIRFCRALQEKGGKVGAMKNPLLVVHCGIRGTSGKGRSPYVEGYMRALADAVGAETNART